MRRRITPKQFSAEPAGGASLQQQVQTQLRSSNPQAAQNVQVQSSDNGKIVLRGTVSSAAEKRAIENSVQSMQGVKSVDNKIEVQD
jgi:osmotically-inducible protein OsmY